MNRVSLVVTSIAAPNDVLRSLALGAQANNWTFYVIGYVSSPSTLERKEIYCPIQQGLADENPDVDAIYRLAFPLPLTFRTDRRIALGGSAWCPFNSQNTTWTREAFPLLYLPSYCSFRMTDIWRS